MNQDNENTRLPSQIIYSRFISHYLYNNFSHAPFYSTVTADNFNYIFEHEDYLTRFHYCPICDIFNKVIKNIEKSNVR